MKIVVMHYLPNIESWNRNISWKSGCDYDTDAGALAGLVGEEVEVSLDCMVKGIHAFVANDFGERGKSLFKSKQEFCNAAYNVVCAFMQLSVVDREQLARYSKRVNYLDILIEAAEMVWHEYLLLPDNIAIQDPSYAALYASYAVICECEFELFNDDIAKQKALNAYTEINRFRDKNQIDIAELSSLDEVLSAANTDLDLPDLEAPPESTAKRKSTKNRFIDFKCAVDKLGKLNSRHSVDDCYKLFVKFYLKDDQRINSFSQLNIDELNYLIGKMLILWKFDNEDISIDGMIFECIVLAELYFHLYLLEQGNNRQHLEKFNYFYHLLPEGYQYALLQHMEIDKHFMRIYDERRPSKLTELKELARLLHIADLQAFQFESYVASDGAEIMDEDVIHAPFFCRTETTDAMRHTVSSALVPAEDSEEMPVKLSGSSFRALSAFEHPIRSLPVVPIRYQVTEKDLQEFFGSDTPYFKKIYAYIKASKQLGFKLAIDPPHYETYVDENTIPAALDNISALLAALESSNNVFCPVRPPGHHASDVSGGGFCVFNNLAIAIFLYNKRNPGKKILAVDIDVHPGNGTARIVAGGKLKGVHLLNLHEVGIHGHDDMDMSTRDVTNIPLKLHLTSLDFREAFISNVDKLIRDHQPDVIALSLGLDGHEGDYLGHWKLQAIDYQFAIQYLRNQKAPDGSPIRVITASEGGYNIENIAGVARAMNELAYWSPDYPADEIYRKAGVLNSRRGEHKRRSSASKILDDFVTTTRNKKACFERAPEQVSDRSSYAKKAAERSKAQKSTRRATSRGRKSQSLSKR